MTDSVKVCQLVCEQNVPSECIDHLFSGQFEAKFDNVVINYEENGMHRCLKFDNVVIKTKLHTSISLREGTIHSSLSLIMTANGRRVFDDKLNRPEYVSEFARIAAEMHRKYIGQDKTRNFKLWEIVDKF